VPVSSGGGLPTLNPSAAPTGTPIPTATPFATPSIAPTAVPKCFVPNFFNVNTTKATSLWVAAGFSANNLAFSPLVPPNYKIKRQVPASGTKVLCTSTGTVSP
jgi:hypothetical protein